MTIDQTTMVPLGVAAGVLIAVWQMSSRWTKVTDSVEVLTNRIESYESNIKESMKEMREKMKHFEDKLSEFPCPNHHHMKQGGGFEVDGHIE